VIAVWSHHTKLLFSWCETTLHFEMLCGVGLVCLVFGRRLALVGHHNQLVQISSVQFSSSAAVNTP